MPLLTLGCSPRKAIDVVFDETTRNPQFEKSHAQTKMTLLETGFRSNLPAKIVGPIVGITENFRVGSKNTADRLID